ncbi:MAG TPA: type VII secretion protein EccCb, partial [Candidatus Dormibacteraeota bacterium]|nr:type VII secretion protein EccCb [Candidatus Dormibacteraeota bacterium]
LRPASSRGGGAAPDLSDSVRLLDLLGTGGPEDVRSDAPWPARDRDGLLVAPIGLTADGERCDLDLKEAAEGGMGPHGMLIGATGSGKSELLRSLVTALAVTHSPEVLSFVFVDFKGGAAFADLAELPHGAGLITNLSSDLSRVDRMRLALGGELERRQRMLRDAGNLDSIREYQRARARGGVATDLRSMPYLLVVVDEFGELLASRPDFLDLFIGIGRIGRSIGMHLLLASQRLEEGRIRGLEGHLRYRLCLRTFSASESSSVIGTADAYTLPAFPGIGYLKVDTAVYTRFKSAIATAPHRPVDASDGGAEGAVRAFAGVRRLGVAAAGSTTESATTSEMRVIVRNLAARPPGAEVHQVWLPPLEPVITLDRVLAAGRRRHLRVPIGLVDLPAEQRQVPFVVDMSGSDGHLAIVGAPQTGKSMALRTLVTAFALTHSPQDLQIYVIDLGGGTLFSVQELPHVGGVCGKGDRDRIRRVVREMQAIIEDREILFRRHGVDGMASFRRLVASGAVERPAYGDVLLVIDNWGRLRQDVEDLEADVQQLVATGLAYGVHVIIATNRWGELRTAVRDNMGLRVELRLNDPVESDVGRAAAQSLPAGVPGRALAQSAHQLQIALPRIDGIAEASGLERSAEDVAVAVGRRWRGAEPAPPVRMLPALVTPADLAERVDGRDAASPRPPGVPLGVDEFRLDPVFVDLLGADPHLLVLGDGGCGKTSLLRALVAGLCEDRTESELRLWLVDYRRTLVDVADDPHLEAYAVTPAMVKDQVDRLRAILTDRLPGAGLSRAELLRHRWWTGPEHVLVVDDYDLLTGAAGNPLQPLTDLLSQGRDVGFHAVVARRVGGAARGSFEAVYQRLRELGTPGFIMSGDPQEGVLVGTQKATALPAGRGLFVRRGQRTALVQAVHVPPRAP